MVAVLSTLTSTILSLVSSAGYFGILIGMFIESSFIPFPSEGILIPAGALISQGKMSLLLVFPLAVLGSLAGALLNYAIALFIGREAVDYLIDKHGKFFLLNKRKLAKADKYFEEKGGVTTFIGRLIPGIRQLISLPAGFAQMNLLKFCIFTSLGAGLWSLVLILFGYFLGQNTMAIQNNLSMIYLITILIGIIFLIYQIIKEKHRVQHNSYA